MEISFKEKVTEKFLRYISIDTTSDDNVDKSPTTAGQLELARLLEKELSDMGASNVNLDENGYLYAQIPQNDEEFPAIGLIAHLDTSAACSAKEIKPQLAQDFKGGKLLLNAEKNIVVDTDEFEEMKSFIGDDLITTDGTTLLGADDKAGIAEIMTVCEYLLENPEIPHGDIKIAFTPDEEIGRGAEKFAIDSFEVDFAYTLDGGPLPFFEYECFNAASAKINIQGFSVHLGSGKGKLKNAARIANEFIAMLPSEQAPEFTEGHEGFFHVDFLEASVENANIVILVRDHDSNEFEKRKEILNDIANFLNKRYGDDTITLTMEDTYYNMAEIIREYPEIIERIESAMSMAGINAESQSIRGGTDGSKLSFMSLPCPNLPTGGANYHSCYECVSLDQMDKCTNILLNILTIKE